MTRENALKKIDSFSEYKENWDSYKAKPFEKQTLLTAGQVLCCLPDYGWRPTPCSDGSVLLDTFVGANEVEVQIFPSERDA